MLENQLQNEDQKSALRLLSEIIAIDSQSHVCSLPIFDRVERELSGWRIEHIDYIDDRGTKKRNLVARHPDSASPLAFAGHLDTVSKAGWVRDPFAATIEGDCLYGLGSSDMKGPIAAFLTACQTMPPPSRPTIVLTSDEEVGKQGVRETVMHSQLLQEYRPEGFIVAEPTALQIIRGHRVDILFTVRSVGIQAHSSTGRGMNANIALIPFLSEMRELYQDLRTNARLYDVQYEPPYCDLNIVIDNHGVFPNMTAGLSTCQMKFRYSKSFDPGSVVDRITDSARRHDLELTVKRESPPPELAPDHPFVAAVEEIIGTRARVAGLGTEASEYSKIAPCLVFGPGDIEHAHKPTEYIDLQQFYKSIELFRRIALGRA